MSIELKSDVSTCFKCGERYPKFKGNFPSSYAMLHKGLGRIPVCNKCIEQMYKTYLSQSQDAKLAARQICRKLDLFWSEKTFDQVMAKNTTRSVILQYISRLAVSTTLVGKCYDDTLANEGTLWSFSDNVLLNYSKRNEENADETDPNDEPIMTIDDDEDWEVTKDVITFWGTGYSPSMYRELEQRRAYWMSKFPEGTELDIGTEAIIRQICSLELDINRDRAAGKAVDKNINALNTLLGSANLKPGQKRQEEADAIGDSPLGVWLYRFENERPLPDEYEDSKILRYVFTWMGHLCKMLGIKGNKYIKMYEDEIQKYSVDKPEYDGDDEEAFVDMLESLPES